MEMVSIYNYKSYRLPALAAAAELSRVMPIFACTEDFMGEWLMTNPHDKAFDTWLNGVDGYEDDAGAWKTNTCVEGQVWYRYTCMNDDAILTGIEDDITESQFAVWPNPTNGVLNIGLSEKLLNQEMILLDSSGRRISMKSPVKHELVNTLDLSNLTSGVYWLRIGDSINSFVIQ